MDDEIYDQVLIAQTADTLLTMKGIIASFVIAKREDDIIGISARSLGELNVKLIMENLGWWRPFNKCSHTNEKM